MHPRVSIIVLNWNGWRDTIECLESLYHIDYPNYDIIVVDNGSEDDSVKKIEEYCEGKIRIESKFFKYNPHNKPIKVFEVPECKARKFIFNRKIYEKFDVDRRIILIKNERNYGFTGGNNIGMKFAMKVSKPKYVLLLNNDTVVDKKFLTELVKVMEADNTVGISQSKLLKKDNPRIIDSTGHIFKRGRFVDRGHNETDNHQYDSKTSIESACAASSLYRVSMLEAIGLFNENFFAYYEDVELSLRCKRSGWKIKYVPTSVVFHKGHGSTGFKPKFIKSEFEYYLCISSIRNWAYTVLRQGSTYYRVHFVVEYLRSTLASWVGKKFGRNNIGALPYILAFKQFLECMRG